MGCEEELEEEGGCYWEDGVRGCALVMGEGGVGVMSFLT
jgi:hypothetical protein